MSGWFDRFKERQEERKRQCEVLAEIHSQRIKQLAAIKGRAHLRRQSDIDWLIKNLDNMLEYEESQDGSEHRGGNRAFG